MKTTLNLTVCFLWVAQLNSSSNLVLIVIYLLQIISIIISIYRTHMDFYNLTKYENIQDRIKRLNKASNATHHVPASTGLQPFRKNFTSPYANREKMPEQTTMRLNYAEKQTFSRVVTQQTERRPEQQSYTFINDLINLKQNQFNRIPSRQKRPLLGRYNEFQMKEKTNQVEQRPTILRYAQAKIQSEAEKSSLSKAKSDTNLKIDEILQSYNNYKLNKQKFLQTLDEDINKNHQRTVSQKMRQCTESEVQLYPKTQQKIVEKGVFQQIDNIWNQKNTEEDRVPKFMRSKNKNTNQFDQLCEKISSEFYQQQVEQQQPRPASKSKLILKNMSIKKSNQENTDNSLKNLLLSPRGPRVPGKICKNSDKSMVMQVKERL